MKAQALRGFYRQDGSSLQLSRALCSTKFVLFKRLDFYYCLHLDLSFLHHPGPNHSMWVLFLWTSWMCTMDDAMMYFTPIFVICSHIQIMMMTSTLCEENRDLSRTWSNSESMTHCYRWCFNEENCVTCCQILGGWDLLLKTMGGMEVGGWDMLKIEVSLASGAQWSVDLMLRF